MSISVEPSPADLGAPTAAASSVTRAGWPAWVRRVPRPRPELLGLLVLAAVLDLWALGQNDWANTYYSATVRSMTSSWHNFLYASFDGSGVMTVDKPPLALWVQALSARAFGFGTWQLLVPQALMGVASVALVYDLVARRFGRIAGLGGGLAFALTPITVAMSRHNNPDALLVLCSTAALWFLVRGLEDGRTRWLVWAGVMVGLGFEAKMGAALLVVPAITAAYLYAAPRGRWTAVRQLSLGGVALAVVGLAWPVLVWVTPAGSRPWISGTSDNSIWSLIFGYNGLGRVDGQAGGPGGMAGGPGGGRGGGGGPFGGDTGPLRLLNEALGGQAGWLLGFALAGGLALAAATRLRRSDPATGWLIGVGGAFATTAVVFSQAKGIFHPYYVSALAPFTAALVGAGLGVIVRGGLLARVAGPIALLGGLVTELMVLHDNPGSLAWLAPVLGAVVVAAAAGLVILTAGRVRVAVAAAAVGALLIAPATWSAETLGHPTSSTFPAGGPVDAGGGFGGPGGGRFGRGPGGVGRGGFPGGPPPGLTGAAVPPQGLPGAAAAGGSPATGGSGTSAGLGAARGGLRGPMGGFPGPGGGMFGGNANLTQAIAYAKAHGGGTVAVSSQQGASTAIIDGTGTVAALGGFSGRESEVSVRWLADAVRAGRIRWVLTDDTGDRLRGDRRTGSSTVMAAAARVGTAVALGSSGGSLIDLEGKADALTALAG